MFAGFDSVIIRDRRGGYTFPLPMQKYHRTRLSGILVARISSQPEREAIMGLVESIRLQWVLIPFLVLAGLVLASSHAVELQLHSTTVPAGATTSLELEVHNADDAPTTLVLDLVFDSAVLSLSNATSGVGASGANIAFQDTLSGATVLIYGGSGPFTSGTLATLEFSVAPTVLSGEALAISQGDSSGANADAEALGVSLESATLTISLPFTAHHADTNQDGQMSVGEVLRVLQLYNSRAYSCDGAEEDGYRPATGPQDCTPHNGDYAPQDWQIDLSELLRVIQFYNADAHRYHADSTTEDGFSPGIPQKEATR